MQGKSYSAELCKKVRDGEENPFRTIEALGEHAQACWGVLAKSGVEVWEGGGYNGPLRRPNGEPGTFVYHLRAIDQYHKKILNLCAALLPDIHQMADGQITPERREEAIEQLDALIEFHQSLWESI